MQTRQTLVLGLAGLGFVLGLPAQAAAMTQIDLSTPADLVSEFKDTGFVLAKRDENDRYEPRLDPRDETRVKGNKKSQAREAARPPREPQEYGYGYERRHQPAPRHDDDRGRY